MKNIFAIIISLIIGQSAFGQNTPISFVNYADNKENSEILFELDERISEITLKTENEFEFWSRPNVSCLTWREYNGTWKRENDTIIFFDQYDVMENDVKFTFQNNPNNEKFKIYFATDKNSELKKTEIKIQFVYDYDADLKDIDLKANLDNSGNIEIPFTNIPNLKDLASIRYELILPNNHKRYGYITENNTVNKKQKDLQNCIEVTLVEQPKKETIFRVTKAILMDGKLKVISSSKTKSYLPDYMSELVFKEVYEQQNAK